MLQVTFTNLVKTQPSPVDSMREAVLTVSPNRQYLGIACPTTPVEQHTQQHTQLFVQLSHCFYEAHLIHLLRKLHLPQTMIFLYLNLKLKLK